MKASFAQDGILIALIKKKLRFYAMEMKDAVILLDYLQLDLIGMKHSTAIMACIARH